MTTVFELSTTFCQVTPGCCSVLFGMLSSVYHQRQADRKTWYCPTCGSNRHFSTATEEAKLRRQLHVAEANAAYERVRHDQTKAKLKTTERLRRAAVGEKTKLANRIKNGMCPCCNRTFQNLLQHMATQHPHFQTDVVDV